MSITGTVWVSTNALAASGVTFADITRALPSRSVLRAAFDPSDPTVIYAVLGGFDGGPGQSGHVFRTTIGGTAWTDIAPALDVPFGALALDGTETPTTIYVGTDLGVLRSVDRGSSWTVLDDIHFALAPVTDLVLSQPSGTLRAATYGRGVSSSSPEFVLPGVDTYPITVEPGDAIQKLPVRFAPTSFGAKSATLTVTSDDPGGPRSVAVSGVAPPPILRVTGTTYFGPVDLGLRAHQTLSICNVGPCDLHVTRVGFTPQPCCPEDDGCGEPERVEHPPNDQRCTDFCLVNNPFPAAVKPGSCLGVLIQYTPTCDGARCCELVIES